MHRTVSAEIGAPPARVHDVVADLATYPAWMRLVARADRTDDEPDGAPAWYVTLRAQIGPLSRSKRLRMVRTAATAPRGATFERREIDGRDHARWLLEVRLAPGSAPGVTTEVAVELRYEGSLWTAPLERVLAAQIDEAIGRLDTHCRSTADEAR